MICDICGKECDSERGLLVHRGRIHKDLLQKMKRVTKIPPETFSVPLGTELKLTGQCFRQILGEDEFRLIDAEGLSAKVLSKELQNNKIFLFCSVFRSEDLWAILEEDVLKNRYEIISWVEDTQENPTPTSPRTDVYIEKPLDQEEKEEYLSKVHTYLAAKENADRANEQFWAIADELESGITDYAYSNGKTLPDQSLVFETDGVEFVGRGGWLEDLRRV